MNILVAVTTCQWRKSNADSQRATWVVDSPVDIRFFIGSGSGSAPNDCGDTVYLTCSDDYKGLPEKVQLAFRWALDNGYDYICKADDDVYLRPERLVGMSNIYSGLRREAYFEAPGGFCSGFCYCVNKRAMEVIAESPKPDLEAEDRWVANTLYKADIVGAHDGRFLLTSGRYSHINRETPTAFNDLIAVAEYTDMTAPHNNWLASLDEWKSVTEQVLI